MKKTVLVVATSLSLSIPLGYQTLNRFDPRPFNVDTGHYYKMAMGNYDGVGVPFRFRPLVPAVAHVFWRVVRHIPLGTWDRVFVSMLLANALFLALTALLIVHLAESLGRGTLIGFIAILFHHASFITVNEYLIGRVDSADGFLIVLVTTICLANNRWFLLFPLIALSPLVKDSSLILTASFSIGYILVSPGPRSRLTWAVAGLVVGVGTLLSIQAISGGGLWAPYELAWVRIMGWFGFAPGVLFARTTIYSLGPSIVLLLLFGWQRIRATPRPIAIGLAAALVFGYAASIYGEIGENIGRPLWSVLGWWLSIWVADGLVEKFRSTLPAESRT